MGRRRLAFVTVWLASCNQIVGIHELPPNDARVTGDGPQSVDAAIDAPAEPCTMNGATRCNGRLLQACVDDVWKSHACDFTCTELGGTPTCAAASNMSSVATSCGGADPSTWPTLDPGTAGTITYTAAGSGMTLACATASGVDCGQIAAASVDTANPPGVAWFCVRQLLLEAGARLVADGSAMPAYALGLVVDGDADIDGTIALDAPAAAAPSVGGFPGPGGFAGGSADGTSTTGATGSGIDMSGGFGGQAVFLTSPMRVYLGGGGGGGNSTGGAAGGTGSGAAVALGGAGGGVIAATWLLGGGGGGAVSSGPPFDLALSGGGGGGAIQISARGQIEVSGTISAKGGAGYPAPESGFSGTGGGAGGMLLLEAPTVTGAGTLIVDGGDGGSGFRVAGGAGATGAGMAERGASDSDAEDAAGGGGGAGAGRIAVHSGSATCPASVSPTYSCTAALLQGSAE